MQVKFLNICFGGFFVMKFWVRILHGYDHYMSAYGIRVDNVKIHDTTEKRCMNFRAMTPTWSFIFVPFLPQQACLHAIVAVLIL